MKRTLLFKPEGETTEIQFEYGHACGKQLSPSIGLCLPDEKWKTRNSVMTHKQVESLIEFLKYHQKHFERDKHLGLLA